MHETHYYVLFLQFIMKKIIADHIHFGLNSMLLIISLLTQNGNLIFQLIYNKNIQLINLK